MADVVLLGRRPRGLLAPRMDGRDLELRQQAEHTHVAVQRPVADADKSDANGGSAFGRARGCGGHQELSGVMESTAKVWRPERIRPRGCGSRLCGHAWLQSRSSPLSIADADVVSVRIWKPFFSCTRVPIIDGRAATGTFVKATRSARRNEQADPQLQ